MPVLYIQMYNNLPKYVDCHDINGEISCRPLFKCVLPLAVLCVQIGFIPFVKIK